MSGSPQSVNGIDFAAGCGVGLILAAILFGVAFFLSFHLGWR